MKTLKDCLYGTIHRNEKPLKQIAEEIGMSENYLTRAALPDAEDSDTGTGCRFPLKKLIPLIRTTDDFTVLNFIERSLGRVAVPIPPAHTSIKDIYRLSMQAIKEFGELMSCLDEAIADGRLSAVEKAEICREGYEAIQAIMQLVIRIDRNGKNTWEKHSNSD